MMRLAVWVPPRYCGSLEIPWLQSRSRSGLARHPFR